MQLEEVEGHGARIIQAFLDTDESDMVALQLKKLS